MFKPRTFLITGVVVAAGFAVELAVTTAMWGPPTYPAVVKPVLTLAQHKAGACQGLDMFLLGFSYREAKVYCGDSGPANAIDPYLYQDPPANHGDAVKKVDKPRNRRPQ